MVQTPHFYWNIVSLNEEPNAETAACTPESLINGKLLRNVAGCCDRTRSSTKMATDPAHQRLQSPHWRNGLWCTLHPHGRTGSKQKSSPTRSALHTQVASCNKGLSPPTHGTRCKVTALCQQRESVLQQRGVGQSSPNASSNYLQKQSRDTSWTHRGQ